MATGQERLGGVLVELGLIAQEQLDTFLEEQRKTGVRLGAQIVAADIVTEDRLVAALSQHLSIESIDPRTTKVHDDIKNLVPSDLAYRHRIIPVARRKEGNAETLVVVTADPYDDDALATLCALLPGGLNVSCLLAGEDDITAGLLKHYGPPAHASSGDGKKGSADLPRFATPDGRQPKLVEDLSSPTTGVPQRPPSKSPTPAPKPKEEAFGDFVIESRIGVGGMAELFLARKKEATSADARVLLKRVLPTIARNETSEKMFFGEAERAVGLRHPNVTQLLEFGIVESSYYMTTEYVGGHDLERVLGEVRKNKTPLSMGLGLHIADEILKGLEHAHQGGADAGLKEILHGHVCPACVQISDQGKVKIGDFGVARSILSQKSAYLSPEQVKGEEIDKRTDVFAVGLILYEMLTGVPLFKEEQHDAGEFDRSLMTFRKTLRQHIEEPPPQLEAMLQSALAREPQSRFVSAQDFGNAIAKYREEAKLPGTAFELSQFMRQLDTTTKERQQKSTPGKPVVEQTTSQAILESALEVVPRIREASQKVSPRVREITERTGPRVRSLGKRGGDFITDSIDWLINAPIQVKAAMGAAVGVLIVVVLISAFIGRGPEPTTGGDDVATGGTDPAAGTDQDLPPDAPDVPEEPTRIEILPGVYDETAAEGFAFVNKDGVELRATAEKNSEAILWLKVGQRVQKMSQVEGAELVMIPPNGPAGFLSEDALVDRTPVASLAQKIGFKRCSVKSGYELDDCLFGAKKQSDTCLERCSDPESRCPDACKLAFETCINTCNASAEAPPPPKKKRRRRRGR